MPFTIPLTYNVRNLRVRKVTTIMTSLAAALSVLVLVAVLALVAGVQHSFELSANPKHLILLRNGSTSELVSILTRENFQDILSRDGIAKDGNGQPLASLEMVTIVSLPLQASGDTEMNVTLRGLTYTGWKMRQPRLKLTGGRLFQAGAREVVIGQGIADNCPTARLGGTLYFGDTPWTVVGIMNAGQASFNSEIFADLNQVSSQYRRFDQLSSVLLESASSDLEPLARSLREDTRLRLEVESEREYYGGQTSAALPVQFMGTMVAVIMAIGAAFACMNTMYTSIARRSSEIGILRMLGFSRFSVLLCFLVESVVISVSGGAIGCLLALPLNRFETAVGSYVTWSQLNIHFRVTPEIMLIGLSFAALTGAVGGFLPARSAAVRPLLGALRAR